MLSVGAVVVIVTGSQRMRGHGLKRQSCCSCFGTSSAAVKAIDSSSEGRMNLIPVRACVRVCKVSVGEERRGGC